MKASEKNLLNYCGPALALVPLWGGGVAHASGASQSLDTPEKSAAAAAAIEVAETSLIAGEDEATSLDITRVGIDEAGISHTHFQQIYNGLKVIGGEAVVSLNVEGAVTSITENLYEGVSLTSTTPALTAEEAYELAWWAGDAGSGESEEGATTTADLVVLPGSGGAKLTWRIDLAPFVSETGPHEPRIFVDALTGDILSVEENLCFGNDNGDFRTNIDVTATYWSTTNLYYLMDATRYYGIVDMRGGTGILDEHDFTDANNIWGTYGNSSDPQNAGVDAMWSVMKAWLYFNGLSWNGWDDNNGPREYRYANNSGTDVMGIRVHYDVDLNNAFWSNVTRTISLGDGDGAVFDPSLATVDIIGHEWTHGIDFHLAQLGGHAEANSLGESWSDVFGEMIEYSDTGNDWKIADDSFVKAAGGVRNMSDPHAISYRASDYTADDDPDHFLERYTGPDAGGEEYANTGISNKAFYLLAATGSHSHHLGGSMTGIGMYNADIIWFYALRDHLTSNSTFADARKATYDAAVDIYGLGHSYTYKVLDAWNLVGITNEPGEINVFSGTGTYGFSGDGGQATAANMKDPYSIDVDDLQNIYVADTSNHRIRKIAPNGIITTIAGGSCQGNSGDGGAATSACLDTPRAVALDPDGEKLYIADSGNNRIRVLDLTSNPISIDHFAGHSDGTPGSSGDNVTADTCFLDTPKGVAVNGTHVYISDSENHVVRRVNSSNVIFVVAGTVGVSGDSGSGGNGNLARLNHPTGLALTSSNVYVADTNNNKVKRISLGSGFPIYDFAGTGTAGYNGNGSPATSYQLSSPRGVAVDLAGAVLIADTNNNRVRKVTGTTISTVAGTGTAGSTGDNGVATSALLDHPADMCVDEMGNVFIADRDSHKIRKIFE